MKYLKTYEGVRDLMTGKSEEDILNSLNKLTPYGMYNKIVMDDLDGIIGRDNFMKIAENRINLAELELDEIFEKDNNELLEIVEDVTKWVEKNGGNSVNIEKFIDLAEQIVDYGFEHRHDSIVIYDDDVFESFRKLLKTFAICEVSNNNGDIGY